MNFSTTSAAVPVEKYGECVRLIVSIESAPTSTISNLPSACSSSSCEYAAFEVVPFAVEVGGGGRGVMVTR